MDEQLRFVTLIASRLDAAGIPYMITGSMALALYATPRMTRDIDLVVECGPQDAPRIAALFAQDCYVSEEEIRDAASRRSMFNVIHNEWIVKADFIVKKDDEYRRVEFTRRRVADIGGAKVSVVAPEDLVLSKLWSSRESRSDLQVGDVRALIAAVRPLDWEYMARWAGSMGIENLLEEMRPR